MRNIFLALPILALSACSAIDQPYLPDYSNTSYGHYDQGCATGACAPGQSYSVAGGPNLDHWPDAALVPNYESAGGYGHHAGQGPVHVNPTGHGPQGHGAQAYGHNGYGAPHLRGLRGPKPGQFYGTLGGVMYDTDVDSFGLEARVGYDSGRGFLGATYGAELEGSVGIIDEDEGTVDGVNLKSGFDYNVAAFGVARLPLSQRFSLHSRLGYDFRKFSVTGDDGAGNSAKVGVDLDGIAYGIGAEYALSPVSGLRLDFTEYDNEFGAAQSVSASFTRKF